MLVPAAPAWAGDSAPTAAADAMSSAPLGVDPAAPGALAISGSGATSATLTWDAAAGAATYRVYRDGVQFPETPALTFTDNTLTATGSYEYHVVAVNGGGSEGPPSTSVYR